MNSVVINDQHKFIDVPQSRIVARGTDILVKIMAVSINPVDLKKSQHNTEPKVLGYDAAGIVIALGSKVENFSIGDRVMYAGSTERPGSYADQQLVDERLVAKAPNKDFAEIAALPLVWLTASEILFEKLHYSLDKNINQQETILVINGAGGVGSVLTQLAHLIGLKVVATSSPKNFDWLKQHGVDFPIDYHQDIVKQVNELGLVIDNSINLFDTGMYFNELIELVRPFGHLVNLTGTDKPIDILKLQKKSQSFDWELMFTKSRFDYHPETQGHLLNLLGQLIETSKIQPITTKIITAPMNAKTIIKAHEIIAKQQMNGKLVIVNKNNI